MDRQMMIDYRDEKETIFRREIDNNEFCIRDGCAYFISEGIRYRVRLDLVIQVYMN